MCRPNLTQALTLKLKTLKHRLHLKGYSTFFLEIGSFHNSLRVKQLHFTVFKKSIQTIF